MTTEERTVLDNEISTSGIDKSMICLKKRSCVKKGDMHQPTNTLLMCDACRYDVFLPIKYTNIITIK